MPDPELNELLGQLESHIADEDESVERAKASLESTLDSLKLTSEEEVALAGELSRSVLFRLGLKARRIRRSRSPLSAWSAGANRPC